MLCRDFEREVGLDHSTESRLELSDVVVVVVVDGEKSGTAEIVVGRERCWPASGQISPLQMNRFCFTCFSGYCFDFKT